MSKNFDQLIIFLEKKLKLTGTQIAEILWLAQQTSTYFSGKTKPTPEGKEKTRRKVKYISPKPPLYLLALLNGAEFKTIKTFAFSLLWVMIFQKLTAPPPDIPPKAPVFPKPSDLSSVSGLPIKVPDRSSLPYPRDIAKALRPLIQYISFGKAVLLDENATVELTAELNGTCIPVLKPQLELKFDLALVIDQSDSMIFWQRLTKEFQQILRNYGIFRNIQSFGLVKDEQGNINLRQEIGKTKYCNQPYSPQKLIDRSGRRVILVVSDCVSEIWRNGQALNVLKTWGKYNMVAIVQMLPERMWLRTRLSLGSMVQLNRNSQISTVANRNLFIKEILIWDDIDFKKSIKVPVFSLTPDSIETWSEMVIGKGTIGAGGFAFSPSPLITEVQPQEQQKENNHQSQLTLEESEERVYNFRMSSSPLARQLATLLASAPVISLPIVRLIQRTLFPQSQKVYIIAEVFLGGILKPTEEIKADTNIDYVQYRFIDEKIRDILLQDSLRMDSRQIIEVISDYFAKKMGKNLKEFYAMLKNPDELKQLEAKKTIDNFDIQHFATITTKVLKRLGGSYARYAEAIENAQIKLQFSGLESFEDEVTIATIVFEPFPPPGPDRLGKNYAISIGVNQYQYLPSLKYAVRDAEVMKHWFDEQNFSSLEPSQIDLRLDPTSATVEEFLQRKFEEPFLSEEDNLWFFFSGHSRFLDGIDYLMLADSITQRVTETGVSLNFLVKQLLRSGAGKVILFLDMDRLTAQSSPDSSSSFVAEGKKEEQGVIIFYACEPNTAAYEAKQLQQGSFTYALLEALKATQGNLSFNQLGKFLRDRVPELNEQNTKPPQTPQSFTFPSSIGDWVPFPSNFQVFYCQTPTVNRRGKTIQQDSKFIQYFPETLTDNVILEMVAIPGGTFTMGSPENEKDSHDDERPQHNVTLSPFFLCKYPITQAQWKAIATRTDLKENIDLEEDPSRFKDPYQKDQETIERWLRPVENVNWYEAVEFCQRLSKLTGRDYQLPSESQWEYACRAMTEPLDLENGESYPPFYFGETITGELANYDASNTYADEPEGEYRQETTPVGQFPPNAFGLYDMHGNIWEWCADDWHENYEDAPTDGSAWMEFEPSYLAKNKQNDSNSVLRGGSWVYDPAYCRSAYRDNINSREYRFSYYGVRVVCVFGRTQ